MKGVGACNHCSACRCQQASDPARGSRQRARQGAPCANRDITEFGGFRSEGAWVMSRCISMHSAAWQAVRQRHARAGACCKPSSISELVMPQGDRLPGSEASCTVHAYMHHVLHVGFPRKCLPPVLATYSGSVCRTARSKRVALEVPPEGREGKMLTLNWDAVKTSISNPRSLH